ncbi:MAG: RHS repeat-associated core domain-containing protein [Terricaulis sp.]
MRQYPRGDRLALWVLRIAACAAIACFTAMVTTLPASAQSIPPPPVRSAVDANGVDLTTGILRIAMPGIAVGQPGAGGLSYARVFDSGAQAWRDNLTGTINSSGATYTVTLYGGSQVFTLVGGVYVAAEPDGATLAFSANIYTYRTRNGAVALYDKGLAGSSPTQANEGRITTFTAPSGEVQTFTYTALNATTQRLQSLNNNFGYQLKFEYQNNDPATGGLTLIKVTAINNAVDYCSPTADSCAGFTQTWPSLSFDAALPTTVTDALGRVTRYTYVTNRVSAIRRPSSAVDNVTFTWVIGRVRVVTNGVGTWNYGYTPPTGNIGTTTITDPLGHQRVVTWDASLNLILTDRDALNRTTTFTYGAANRLARVTQPEGNYAALTYDARGNVTQTTQVAKAGSGLANIVTSAAYATTCTNPVTCNMPTSTTDARGFRTDYTYNSSHGGVETITAPAPSGTAPVGSGARPQTRIAYQQFSAYYKNSAGVIVAAPTGVTLPSEISACATTSSCVNGADETRTVIGYGSNGVANNRLPVATTVRSGDNALSVTSTVAYDAIGNAITIDGPLAGSADTTRTRYDAGRQVVGVIGPDPDGAGPLKHRAQRLGYNFDGQLVTVDHGNVNSQSDPDWAAFTVLERATMAYDAVGRRIRSDLIDVGTGNALAVSQVSYDAANRPECVVQRMNAAVFGALPAACTLSTQGANGPDRITRTAYNNADQPIQVTSGYGTAGAINEATTSYTNNGLQATLADGAGNLTTFVYDGFDRLSRMRYPQAANGAVSSTTDYEETTYNIAANTTTQRRRDGQVLTLSADNLGRVTLVDAPGTGLDVTRSYDLFSRQLSAASGGQSLSFAYDQLSRLTSATAAQGSVSYLYDAASRRTRMTWPDGFYVAYDYDLAGAVTAMRENGAASGVGVLASFAYDNLGRRASLARGNGVSTAYAYDAASRLATLTQDLTVAGQDQSYGLSYNAASQITERTGSNAAYDLPAPVDGTTSYSANGLNQYGNVAGASLTYDSLGNLTGLAGAAYGYDVANRLTSATPAGASAATLAYDAIGRLRETVGAGATTRFLYDGADMVAEYNGANVMQRRFVHGPGVDEPLVWYEGAGTSDRRWLLADQLGSVVAVTNASGAATSINAYDEYGTPAATNTGRFQYTGQMWLPEAGVYHYKARAYLPALGRFAQTDPIGFGGGMNLYAYVGNDPVGFSDPMGLAEVCATPTGSRIPRCVNVDGNGNGDSSDVDLTPAQIRMLAAAFREFIYLNDEADLKYRGATIGYGFSLLDENLVRAVSQFIGANLRRGGWGDTVIYGGNYLGRDVAGQAHWERQREVGRGVYSIKLNMNWGDHRTNPSGLARTMIHEYLHRRDNMGMEFRNSPVHQAIDAEARRRLVIYGLAGGGCAPVGGHWPFPPSYPGC